MRLTDENVRGIKDDMEPGYFIEPCDIPSPDTIHALATEVLESRAEIARLTKDRDEARKWERLHEVELSRTMLVLGQRFTLAPPDGGDVRPREAAKSAIEALAAAEARVAELEGALENTACSYDNAMVIIQNQGARIADLSEALETSIASMEFYLLPAAMDGGVGECKAVTSTMIAVQRARAALGMDAT